jgi:subtilase family serine protease
MFKRLLVATATVISIASSSVPLCYAGTRIIDDAVRVVLSHNVNPNARPEFDIGETDYSLPMEHMIIALQRSAEKQAELDKLLADQQNPSSAGYHKWLTPEEFGENFGAGPDDITAVTSWLTSHGFVVEELPKSRTWINFSGKVADVESAFNTQIHDFYVNGQAYHANAVDPSIPQGLADVVGGVVSLHNFPRKPMNHGIAPEFTDGSSHYLSPGDFATIYDVNALYNAGINGTGQTIAIVGRTHPSSSNWATFRSSMGLPANPPQVIVNGTDPGDLGADEDAEADLDVEWSGAVAKNATIDFVVSKSTNTTDGVDLSAQYIVDNNIAPVMSTSFGECETQLGAAENTFYNNLWMQAESQGITPFVAAGDSGVAGCSDASSTTGTGQGVNGLASTPYNIAVGGTEFNEGSGSYWSSTNATNESSALSYVPEIAWNESGAASICPPGDTCSDLWATGGGASSLYSKPSWQVAPGVPSDGKRDVPDISLSAAGHDAYLVETQGALYAIGGTSASSPSSAGIMALIVQKTGQRQGNAAVRLYQLGNAQFGSAGTQVFHDITSGNNSVPGVTGHSCTVGYDLATGLGSIDASALVNNWAATTPTPSTVPDFALVAATTTLPVAQGSSGTTTISTTVSNGFNASIAFSVSGLPSGITASFNPASISAPGKGSSTLTLTASSTTIPGTYSLTITGTGGTKTHSATLTLTVTGITTLLSDNFSEGGWYEAELSGTGGSWSLTSKGIHPAASPYNAQLMADFNSSTAAANSQTLMYKTPSISVSNSFTTVTLTFWMYHDTANSGDNDRIQAQITTNGTSWIKVGPAISRYNGTTGWAQASIDLSAYKGNTFYLGFVGISGKGNDIYLDDVSVVAH